MIGLVGAHRVGKSTLGMSFAQDQRIPFVETNASGLFRLAGMDPAKDYPLAQRIAMQYIILDSMEKMYAAANKHGTIWVADRTPIDMAAYMLADVQRGNANEEGASEAIVSYVDRCMEVTNQFFTVLMLVQPGIEFVPAEGKAPPNPAYQEHLSHLMFGLIMDERLSARPFFIRRGITGIEERKMALFNAATATIKTWKETASASTEVQH